MKAVCVCAVGWDGHSGVPVCVCAQFSDVGSPSAPG